MEATVKLTSGTEETVHDQREGGHLLGQGEVLCRLMHPSPRIWKRCRTKPPPTRQSWRPRSPTPAVLELETQHGGWCPAVGDKAPGSQPTTPAGRGADAGLQLGLPVPGLLGAARVGREGGAREALSGGRGDCPEGAAHSPAGNLGREPCEHKRCPEVSRGGAELPEVHQREESGLEEKVVFPALGHTQVSRCCVEVSGRWHGGDTAGGPSGSGAAGGCGVTTGAPPCPAVSSGVGTPAGPGVPLRQVPRR